MITFEKFLEMKFFNMFSLNCGHCKQSLLPTKISFNPNHIYDYGQSYECNCGKSKVWTNSVRNPKNLINFYKGIQQCYTNGFCNDIFCGYCFKYLTVLKNGVEDRAISMTTRLDRFGCRDCKDNQEILVDLRKNDPENDTSRLHRWYKNRQDELEKLSNED